LWARVVVIVYGWEMVGFEHHDEIFASREIQIVEIFEN
jgi:hypothetical protein